MSAALVLLGALWRRPALRNALLILALVAGLCGAVALYLRGVREGAARDAIREIEKQHTQGVKDAIKRAAPGPRPVVDEFLDCLRRGGPGCL